MRIERIFSRTGRGEQNRRVTPEQAAATAKPGLAGLVGAFTESPQTLRRARLLGTDQAGEDRTLVLAEVPQAELVTYVVDLRASTHGAGVFTRSFAHYEPVPEEVARHLAART